MKGRSAILSALFIHCQNILSSSNCSLPQSATFSTVSATQGINNAVVMTHIVANMPTGDLANRRHFTASFASPGICRRIDMANLIIHVNVFWIPSAATINVTYSETAFFVSGAPWR